MAVVCGHFCTAVAELRGLAETTWPTGPETLALQPVQKELCQLLAAVDIREVPS